MSGSWKGKEAVEQTGFHFLFTEQVRSYEIKIYKNYISNFIGRTD
jgi:hypothetical protein